MQRYILILLITLLTGGAMAQQGLIILEQQLPSTQVMITATEQVILKPGFHAIGSAGTFNAKIGSENSMSPVIPMAAGSTAVIQTNPVIPIISIEPAVASLDQNYVVSTVAYKEVTDATALNETNSNTGIQYFDGLGRPSQTVQHGVTPLGADLVSGIEYDDFGRDYRHWLPGAAAGNGGAYVSDFGAKATSTNGGDANPYVETILESSPLNRPLGQHQPGADWYTHPTGIDYKTNVAGEVIYFSVENNQLKRNGNYDPNTLYKTVVTDEDKKTTTEFKDKLGQVVLKRGEEGGHVDTYYVYNDLSQLSYVIPPKAVDELTDFSDDNAIMKQYCYLYQYDGRGNCIYKRLPGCEPILMVYDKAYRLILSQDGNQRTKTPKQWTVSKYDQLGRGISTGLTNSITASHTDLINSYKNDLIIETYNSGAYTNNKFSDATSLTVNYYDNYDFIPVGNNLSYDSSQEQNGYTAQYSSVKGLLTGTVIYRLNDPTKFETTAMYYDKYGRVVQTRASNHLNGYDITYNALDFTGKPSKTYKTHGINGTSDTYKELYRYAYDKAQRLTSTTYSLNGGSPVILASNTYDESGRVSTKNRHNGADPQSYMYNIRNWPTKITSGSFEENLYYNSNLPSGTTANYNGNIAYSTWTYNGVNKGYSYVYDGLNRLTAANFKQGSSSQSNDSFNESFTFDKMGNILALQRKSNNKLVDDLTLHYANGEKSNQIDWITDAQSTQGLNDTKEYQDISKATSNEFAYDANGNMIKDLDRDIYTIKYNVLNLPDAIQFKNGNQIINSYDASGHKLGTEYFTWRPGANAPVVNAGDILNVSYSQATTDQNGTAYIGNIEYNTLNGNTSLTSLSRIYNDEGYVENPANPQYYYFRHDHLGDNREVWLANTGETVQRTQYYPSGLPWAYNKTVDHPDLQHRKYNGKEFVEMHGYDTYDYGARGMYPAMGRFTSIDPLAEKYYSISPYAYCKGDPVNYIDPNGEFSTKFGAWLYKVFNGGGQTLKDKATGEYFVSQKVDDKTVDASVKRNFDWNGRTQGEKQYGQENGASINGTGSSQLMELSTSKYHEPSIDMQDQSNAAVDMLAKMFKNINSSTVINNRKVDPVVVDVDTTGYGIVSGIEDDGSVSLESVSVRTENGTVYRFNTKKNSMHVKDTFYINLTNKYSNGRIKKETKSVK